LSTYFFEEQLFFWNDYFFEEQLLFY